MIAFGWIAHLIIGYWAMAFMVHYIPISEPYLILVGLFGSLLPDVDHPKSMLGRFLYLPLGHRGFTHSIIGSAILCIPLLFLLGKMAFIYCYIGALSHCFADFEFKII